MVSLTELNESFGIPGVLVFEEPQPGFVRATVTTAACTAEVYLHGAHLTHWQRAGAEPVIYLSPNSLFAEGKAIRGGVPVIFPWFGARTLEITGATTAGSQHGFARTQSWDVAFVAQAGESLRMTLTLGPSEASRAAGFGAFRVAMEFDFDRSLGMRLTVANQGSEPMVYEEALHSYFCVGDPEKVSVLGLGDTEFLDKTDGSKRKRQDEEALTFGGETDRTYANTAATVTIVDAAMGRRIVVAKEGSETTVVWNPWETLSASMADLGAGEWKNFVCVETANAGENRVTLAPGAARALRAVVSLEDASL